MPKSLASIFVLGALIVAVPVAPARTTGTLALSHAILAGRVNQVECPPGTDASTACFQTSGTGVVPGLGVVSEQYLNYVEDPDSSCERWHSSPVLTVRGKGELDLSVHPAHDSWFQPPVFSMLRLSSRSPAARESTRAPRDKGHS
jgi:hypothetical protein